VRESVILKAVCDYLTTRTDIYWFRSAAGAVHLPNGRYFKTGRPGCPDVTVCRHGFIALEIKNETGRQSAIQKQAQAEIEAAGGEYHIVRSVSDVKRIFA
jgi:hypothetical protein